MLSGFELYPRWVPLLQREKYFFTLGYIHLQQYALYVASAH